MATLPRGQIFSSPIEIILQWMFDQSRSKTLNELQSCGEQEVERVARDSQPIRRRIPRARVPWSERD